MEKPSTLNSTPSAEILRTKLLIERLVKLLDPDYPSIVVEANDAPIDEPASRYLQSRPKPDFVAEDDSGWQTF